MLRHLKLFHEDSLLDNCCLCIYSLQDQYEDQRSNNLLASWPSPGNLNDQHGTNRTLRQRKQLCPLDLGFYHQRIVLFFELLVKIENILQ